jgi:hypothetical protein
MNYVVCACAIFCAATFFSIGMLVADPIDSGYAIVAAREAAR